MASLQAKISWERLRKRENNNKKIVPMSSCPTRNREFKKKVAKIFKKIKKHHYCFLPSQNKQGKAEEERKKKKKSFR